MPTKYIFVAGGVMSGVGKGVATASIGKVLQSKGYSVTAMKIDPYINIDAGTIRPTEHGEVFVTEDGTECDQDIGNYERFLDENIYDINYITTGRVYLHVIQKERNLEYNGEDVEVVPDIPLEVIRRIKNTAKKTKADFILVEIGGTVGEYQNILFIEAARMLRIQEPNNVLFFLVSYLPIPNKIGEMKTKPTQHAVRSLNSTGVQPDFLICRSELPIDQARKEKLSMFCNIEKECVISAPDIDSIYDVPVNFDNEHLAEKILHKLNMKVRKKDLEDWRKLSKKIKNLEKEVRIGIVGKYFETGNFTLMDSYISVIESIKHAAWANNRKPIIESINSEEFEKNPKSLNQLDKYDGIIVPGGFGNRGTEGKIKAIEYCRKNKIPFFGLCLGLQLSVIEFARNVVGIKDATSREFDKNAKNPVIDVMEEQKKLLKEKHYGGTMRLGAYDCQIQDGTISHKAYKDWVGPKIASAKGPYMISERHRHRYELNNDYRDILKEKGLVMAGVNPKKNLVEIIELKNHPFFIGTQFHPEFKSRPLKPHPLFKELIRAAIKNQ